MDNLLNRADCANLLAILTRAPLKGLGEAEIVVMLKSKLTAAIQVMAAAEEEELVDTDKIDEDEGTDELRH